jgi:hypothetical protein
MSMPDDELIDRAARAMMQGEPSDRLRHAVRARIESPPPLRLRLARGGRSRVFGSSAVGQPVRRYWLPVAVAAALVLAVVAARSLSAPRLEPLRTVRFASAQQVAPPVVLQPASPLLSVRRIDTAVRDRRPARPPRLLAVEPLVIEPISVPLIAVDSDAGVMPIEIEPLQIEPLQPQ